MAKAQDRKEIVSRIGDAAKLYRDRLVGKRFMYVFDGLTCENITGFYAKNLNQVIFFPFPELVYTLSRVGAVKDEYSHLPSLR